ncbi:uncharacterized protein LOC135162226 isoform X2 [Diachasmimorpha longicaudata]
MNTHLRRVLQAKCIVDAKNPRYVQRHENYKYLRGEKCLHKCHSYDNITISTRNSQYQLMDMLQPSCGATKGSTKSLASFKSPKCDKHLMDPRRKIPSRQELGGCRVTMHLAEPERPVMKSYPADQIYPDYESSFEASTNTSERGITETKDHKSTSPKKNASKRRRKQLENLKYLKFLHDITQEIIDTGIHRDEEIKDVIKKHLAKNLSILNRKKMLKKLHQLTSALNIAEDEEEEGQESDTSSDRTCSSIGKNQSTINRNERSDKSEEIKSARDSSESQESDESIEWQSEIESVINEEDSTSERIHPLET